MYFSKLCIWPGVVAGHVQPSVSKRHLIYLKGSNGLTVAGYDPEESFSLGFRTRPNRPFARKTTRLILNSNDAD